MTESITVVHNQTVLITGGARGIGRAIVERFALEGYNIAINYNSSEQRAKELLEELTTKEIPAIIVKADISKEEEVKAMVDAVVDKFGKIDVDNADVIIVGKEINVATTPLLIPYKLVAT